MRRRDKAGGKAVKTQRPKTLKRRNTPKCCRRIPADEVTDVARLTRERDEALEQQAAMSEILGVISTSRTDLARCSAPSLPMRRGSVRRPRGLMAVRWQIFDRRRPVQRRRSIHR